MHSLLFFVQAIVIAFCMVLSLALKYARIRFIVHICMSIILKRSRKGGVVSILVRRFHDAFKVIVNAVHKNERKLDIDAQLSRKITIQVM